MNSKEVINIIGRLSIQRDLYVIDCLEHKRINEAIYTLIDLFIPIIYREDFLKKYYK